MILDGTDSKAVGHVTCTWTVEESGSATRKDKKKGCRVEYRFHHAGIAHVTLIVRGSVGSPARLTQDAGRRLPSERPAARQQGGAGFLSGRA